MDRSPGFGSIIYDLYRPLQTRFLFGSIPYSELNLAIYNNSLDRSTKSTISRLKSLYLLVNIGFQVLFHSPPGVLFTFPSRYYFTIDHQVVFSLTGWSPLFHTRFLVSRTTLDATSLSFPFIYWTFTFYGMLFQNISTRFLSHFCSPSPQVNYFSWFRLFLFRSPLLQESSFLSFPAGTKMFQFPAFPSHTLLYLRMDN